MATTPGPSAGPFHPYTPTTAQPIMTNGACPQPCLVLPTTAKQLLPIKVFGGAQLLRAPIQTNGHQRIAPYTIDPHKKAIRRADNPELFQRIVGSSMQHVAQPQKPPNGLYPALPSTSKAYAQPLLPMLKKTIPIPAQQLKVQQPMTALVKAEPAPEPPKPIAPRAIRPKCKIEVKEVPVANICPPVSQPPDFLKERLDREAEAEHFLTTANYYRRMYRDRRAGRDNESTKIIALTRPLEIVAANGSREANILKGYVLTDKEVLISAEEYAKLEAEEKKPEIKKIDKSLTRSPEAKQNDDAAKRKKKRKETELQKLHNMDFGPKEMQARVLDAKRRRSSEKSPGDEPRRSRRRTSTLQGNGHHDGPPYDSDGTAFRDDSCSMANTDTTVNFLLGHTCIPALNLLVIGLKFFDNFNVHIFVKELSFVSPKSAKTALHPQFCSRECRQNPRISAPTPTAVPVVDVELCRELDRILIETRVDSPSKCSDVKGSFVPRPRKQPPGSLRRIRPDNDEEVPSPFAMMPGGRDRWLIGWAASKSQLIDTVPIAHWSTTQTAGWILELTGSREACSYFLQKGVDGQHLLLRHTIYDLNRAGLDRCQAREVRTLIPRILSYQAQKNLK
ncbi:unnamed protein product, partial [Mesorhabditis spiculigera]